VIRVDRLMPDPDQPRTEFDPEALEQLAGSLRTRGQLQPIRARWSAEADRYIIVVGERRWRAAALAGIEALECVVVDGTATPDEILEDQLVENALRADLKPVEQGRAYDRLMKARGLSQRALAERLNVSQAAVAKAVALLTLPEPIQTEVDAGSIGPDIAYQLSKIDDVREQAEMAGRASEGRLRRDEIKERTRATSSKGRSTGKGKAKQPTVRAIRVDGGSKVTVENRKGLNGRLIVAALELALATARAELGDDQVAA
jgi:ParB family transcriptional regulator, chromosome partitioning protein